MIEKNKLRNEFAVMGRDVKKQADDRMAKDKIREASCNRGEEDMIEIAKRWSLRQSDEAVCETIT